MGALCQYHTISQDKSSHLVLNLSRSQTKLEMLQLLSLFVLPYLLPTAEAKGAFLYFYFGEGCSVWDLALSCISILFTVCCFLSAISSCCKGNVKNEEADFPNRNCLNGGIKETCAIRNASPASPTCVQDEGYFLLNGFSCQTEVLKIFVCDLNMTSLL